MRTPQPGIVGWRLCWRVGAYFTMCAAPVAQPAHSFCTAPALAVATHAQGRGYSLNVPLVQGIDTEQYLGLFKPIIRCGVCHAQSRCAQQRCRCQLAACTHGFPLSSTHLPARPISSCSKVMEVFQPGAVCLQCGEAGRAGWLSVAHQMQLCMASCKAGLGLLGAAQPTSADPAACIVGQS